MISLPPIPWEAFAVIGSAFLGLVGWAMRLQMNTVSSKGKIKKLFEYKDAHEKEAGEWRTKYEREHAELRGQIEGLAMANGKEFAAILTRLDKMEENQSKQFERLEEKIDRLEDRRR